MTSLFCPNCKDKSKGWEKHFGIPACITCGATMLNPENWAIILNKYGLRPLSTRILVQEDEYSSKYDCKTCGGLGHTNEKCPTCEGTKKEKVYERVGGKLDYEDYDYQDCSECSVGIGALKKTYGFKLCPTCAGQGGTIIMPDDTKKPPTTGTIIAIGTEVTEFNVGDKVLYSNYTGNNFNMFGLQLRTMHETDVYCQIKNYDVSINSSKQVEPSFPIEEKIETEANNLGV